MNHNDLIAIIILLIAVSDTVLAQFVLPKIFSKNPQMKPEDAKRAIMTLNIVTVIFFIVAIYFYLAKPL